MSGQGRNFGGTRSGQGIVSDVLHVHRLDQAVEQSYPPRVPPPVTTHETAAPKVLSLSMTPVISAQFVLVRVLHRESPRADALGEWHWKHGVSLHGAVATPRHSPSILPTDMLQ